MNEKLFLRLKGDDAAGTSKSANAARRNIDRPVVIIVVAP